MFGVHLPRFGLNTLEFFGHVLLCVWVSSHKQKMKIDIEISASKYPQTTDTPKPKSSSQHLEIFSVGQRCQKQVAEKSPGRKRAFRHSQKRVLHSMCAYHKAAVDEAGHAKRRAAVRTLRLALGQPLRADDAQMAEREREIGGG